MNKRKIGDEYEQAAANYLMQRGFKILERNFRNRYGEIDIIAKDKDTICFVEVKYRSSADCGNGWEAVDYKKQHKILQVANYYMMIHNMNEWTPCRFDIISIDNGKVTLIQNAFEGQLF